MKIACEDSSVSPSALPCCDVKRLRRKQTNFKQISLIFNEIKISKFVPVKTFPNNFSTREKRKKKQLRLPLSRPQMANDLYNVQLTNLNCEIALDSEVVVAKLCIGWNNTIANIR